jgi:hypothetical protein
MSDISRRNAVASHRARMRAALDREASEPTPGRGGILAALRRSPLVAADLDLSREETPVRDTYL